MEKIRWMPHKYMLKNIWIYHHLKYLGDETKIGFFLKKKGLIGYAVRGLITGLLSSSNLPTKQ